jgi:ATP-dependent Clp protease ATP-binding subunit ClpB
VEIQAGVLKRRLSERGFDLEVDEAARRYLSEVGYDPVYGARPLKRAIQKHLENPLSKEILAGRFVSGDRIRVTSGKDGLVFEKAG